ncbi:MAG TPA: septum formation initiator family protein [Streptosporangiaceae bacterium]|nr:septum formation initiator family protein [Streptosporangiaceae bacterium]
MAAQEGGGPVPAGGGGAGTGSDAIRPGGRGRPRLTSRAAVLAVVMCAIALSLAYPVREYIAQHRQIDQLVAQHDAAEAQVRSLQATQQRLADPTYVEDQARARLNMCMPDETCYVIINGQPGGILPQPAVARRGAWYVTLWRSVEQADRQAPR